MIEFGVSDTRFALIHEKFEDQVQSAPSDIALTFETQSLTYIDLNRRANQLARRLRMYGVAPDQLVGIYLERGVEMIIAVLGVLKSGSAYLPIDPSYPQEVVARMCEDACPRILITERKLKLGLATAPADAICIDECSSHIEKFDDSNLDDDRNQSGGSLAYVIFTSGSTGRPKGVMVEHRNVLHLWQALERRIYDQQPGCRRVSVNASLSFDSSVKQIVQLLSGRQLVLIPQAVRFDAADLLRYVAEHRVDCLDCTPTQLRGLLSAGMLDGRGHIPGTVLIGGEKIDASLWRTLADHRDIAFHNLYGPTECTVDATTALICETRDEPVIGRPLSDTRIHILDVSMQPVAVGVTGECYISSSGVARGYLGRPELTAERFIADPFSASVPVRMYRTGDLCRRRTDGCIEYMGRNDSQVKVRGFRVELAEVEAGILEHDEVASAVALAWEDGPGEMRLVAYAVPSTAHVNVNLSAGSGAIDEFVQQWRVVHDEYSYRSTMEKVGPSFSGWNSSYTDSPIPHAEMREWLDCTVARIRLLQPRRVMEIGCGVGLLVEKIAPDCVAYCASDVSSAAVERMQEWLATQPHLRHVEVSRRAATDLGGIASAPFDTVILNSVLQFFPNAEYLMSVLEQALCLVRATGQIFIGDVRNLNLLALFHGAVQLAKADAGLTVRQVLARARASMERDKDLVVAPEFFETLSERFPRISDVVIQLKRGSFENELTGYRYDVVLYVGHDVTPAHESVEFAYEGPNSKNQLGELLERRPAAFRLCGVPNRRLSRDLKVQEILASREPALMVGEISDSIKHVVSSGEDPEEFWSLGEQHGYSVNVRWSRESREGRFDVEFQDRHQPASGKRARSCPPLGPATETLQSEYTNNPIAIVRREHLASQLREFLMRRLPEHMVPSAFVMLERLPLTPNGKVDRGALPAPEFAVYSNANYEAPVGMIEQRLADIWQEVLRNEKVGRDDNFFALGGNSLSAVKTLARVSASFAVTISVLAVFEYPTVRKMAELVGSRIGENGPQFASSQMGVEEGTL